MATLNTNIARNNAAWDSVATAIANKGGDVSGQAVEAYATAIDNIVVEDGFEMTPDLRQYTNIEQNFRADALFTARFLIIPGEMLPIVAISAYNCTSINWGDGSGWSDVSAGQQALTHTYTTYDVAMVIEIISTTNQTSCFATLAKPSNVSAARVYIPRLLWMVYDSATIPIYNATTQTWLFQSFSNTYLQRIWFNAPANRILRYLTNNQTQNYYHVSKFVVNSSWIASGLFSDLTQFFGDWLEDLSLTISGNGTFNGPAAKNLTIAGTGNITLNINSYTRNQPKPIKTVVISCNAVTGDWSSSFQNSAVEEIDLSGCAYNGITAFTNNAGMTRLKKLLFPSVLSGITSMGAIDISNSALTRTALVAMFNSLPTNAIAVNLTITGSVGAADLTAGEIAIATGKNWNVIRA